MAPQASDPEALAATFLEAERAVVLTGLRLGGPESRDLTHADGEWARRASLEAFLTEPARFWEYFYPTALTIAAREPGPAHEAIARLQRAGLIADLITQAVNRLHARAGSPEPVEVYGTVLISRCERCGERYVLPEVGALIAASADGVPRCSTAGCGYPLRPEGTLWGESLPRHAIERAWEIAAAGRRLHRPRLGPAHGADLAASLGAAHPGRAAGRDRRGAHPVRPLRPDRDPRAQHPGDRGGRRPARADARLTIRPRR